MGNGTAKYAFSVMKYVVSLRKKKQVDDGVLWQIFPYYYYF
jgi:hypothetical protein